MSLIVRLILLFALFLTSQSGIATTTNLVNHQYDVNHIVLSDENYGYDTSSNHQNSDLYPSSVKVQDRSFLAFISDFLAPKSARNPGNGLKLNKQLGSQQQLGEKGVPIAGAGSKTPLRDSNRLTNEYGGNASDWAKRSSTRHKAPDGRSFETHWYENSATGQRVEPKTIVQEYLQGK